MESIEEKMQEKEEANLKMSSDIDKVISQYGESESDEWELIDSREVDYDSETELDSQVKEWEVEAKEKPTTLSKILNFVSSGKANTNRKSTQDKEVDGFFFKVRYKYVGNENPERDFCKAMMRANKIYRKEDLAQMSSSIVNAGFGEFGGDFYDIFKFKGGPRCHHKFQRLTFVSATKKQNMQNPNANTISTGKARKFGYNPVNSKEVSMKPNDMKHKGFSPNNTNLPTDAR